MYLKINENMKKVKPIGLCNFKLESPCIGYICLMAAIGAGVLGWVFTQTESGCDVTAFGRSLAIVGVSLVTSEL